MATLAAIRTGMSLNTQQGVHPFFEKNKRLTKYQTSSHQSSSSFEQPIEPNNEERLSVTRSDTNAPSRHSVQTETLLGHVNRANNGCLEISSSSTSRPDGDGFMLANKRNLLSSDGEAKQVIRGQQTVRVNSVEAASLDIDLNSARKKRRRLSASSEPDTTSTDHSAAWLVQLYEAAYGQADPTASAQSNLTDESQTIETGTSYPPLSEQNPDRDSGEDQRTITNVSMPEAGSLEVPSIQHSPPRKKMLQLRADGRLSSPKSRIKGKKSNGKLPLPGSHKVVVIQYGSDEESRNHIGRRIQVIWSEDVKDHGSVVEAPGEQPQLAQTAPSAPPKPTHPFFLGKITVKASGVKPLVVAEPTSISAAGSDSERDLHISPRKSRPSQRHPERFLGSADPKSSSLSQGLTGAFRNTGGVEPAWPTKDAMHVRCLDTTRYDTSIGHDELRRALVKLKGSEVRVPRNEDVVQILASQLPIGEGPGWVESSNAPEILRVPQRKVMTGTQLQDLACREVSTKLQVSQPGKEADLGRFAENTSIKAHPAVSRYFWEIPTSLTAFDRAQCEPYSWVNKYAPKGAEEVLQPGREAVLLRNWLRSLTIEATDTGGAEGKRVRESSASAKRLVRDDNGTQTARRRKRRKRAELLDGFVVSSHDENDEMDELIGPEAGNEDVLHGSGYTQKRSVVRTGDIRESLMTTGPASRLANAVLLSGPHGCGKTAAVYAAAKELGFEVFELNPGSKRSGKDIMDKVGDVARNHLVHHASKREERHEGGLAKTDNERHGDNIAPGPRVTDSFAKMKTIAKRKAVATQGDLKPNSISEMKPKQQAKPKQSLILLEEVDILFDEDKHFWATVLGLIEQSKRPVIMTCNDESLIPLDQMSLHAILRFTQPACDLAADYMLLLAASEGHLLARNAVLALYRSKDLDLRASITELEFWCQMAIGDKKGGLEWMLEQWPAAHDSGDCDQRVRVVSTGTYRTGMGWFNRDNAGRPEQSSKDRGTELLLEAWQNWGINSEDLLRWADTMGPPMVATVASDSLPEASFSALKDYERLADAASATDIFGRPGLSTGYQVYLDTTQPKMSEKMRSNFVEGYTCIQTDILVEHGDLTTVLAMNTQALARSALSAASNPILDVGTMEERLIQYIADGHGNEPANRTLTRMDLAAAFDPLAEPAKRSVSHPTGLVLSEFDRSTSLLVEDLAPYVRSIIAYDLRLEQERLRLSNLLSQGGRDGKRSRTTRASRAALEGGSKTHTRRERWLPAGTNATLVLRTGGQGWQEIAAEYSLQREGDGVADDAGSSTKISRRSSLDSITAGEV